MQLKLNKISIKSFVTVFTVINAISGFFLGAVATLVAIIVPDEPGFGGIGPWSIIIFPIFNGIFALMTGAFLAGIYNLLTKYVGGIVFEYEEITDK